jgi:predicted SprT family Zn-dependent metalloprotease
MFSAGEPVNYRLKPRERGRQRAPSSRRWKVSVNRICASCDSVPGVSQADKRLSELRQHTKRWLALWGVPALHDRLTIEWSPRLYRSLGRAFPGRLLVRLSRVLVTARRDLALEATCHEVAHIVVPVIYGPSCPPHGRDWAELVRDAGFRPRIRLPATDVIRTPKSANTDIATSRRRSPRGLYVHTCPVCHARRIARRPIPRWRCAACVAAGLDGRLTIAVVEVPSP